MIDKQSPSKCHQIVMGSLESVCVHEDDLSNVFEWDHPVIRRGAIFRFSFKEELILSSKKGSEEIRIQMEVNGHSVDDNKIVHPLYLVDI